MQILWCRRPACFSFSCLLVDRSQMEKIEEKQQAGRLHHNKQRQTRQAGRLHHKETFEWLN